MPKHIYIVVVETDASTPFGEFTIASEIQSCLEYEAARFGITEVTVAEARDYRKAIEQEEVR